MLTARSRRRASWVTPSSRSVRENSLSTRAAFRIEDRRPPDPAGLAKLGADEVGKIESSFGRREPDPGGVPCFALAPQRNDSARDLHRRTSRHGQHI